MSNEQQQQPQQEKGSLLDQVKAALQKGAKEGVKTKLMELMKKRAEHEKAMRLIDAEVTKLIKDFEDGLL